MPLLPGVALSYPLINGLKYDYSSVELNIDGQVFGGVKSINYKWSLDPGVQRGTRAQKIGRSRGTYDADGSIEIYKVEYHAIISRLSRLGTRGYAETAFNIVVSYEENVTDVITDQLVGIRLKTGENGHQEGNDPLVVKCDLDIMYILENGLSAIDPRKMLK